MAIISASRAFARASSRALLRPWVRMTVDERVSIASAMSVTITMIDMVTTSAKPACW